MKTPANSHGRDWDRTSDLPRVKRGEGEVMRWQGQSDAPKCGLGTGFVFVKPRNEANVTYDRRVT